MCDSGCPLLAAVREEVRRVLGEVQRPEANGPLLLSVPQAAEMLALSEREIYRLLDAGEIASVRVGRCRRVVAVSVAGYVERLREEGTS